MINAFAQKVADYIIVQIEYPQEKKAVLTYGLEVIIGGLIKLIVFLVIPYSFGILTQTWATLISSSLLRLMSGGAHCTSFFRCLTGSLCIFLTLSIIAKLISPYVHVRATLLGELLIVLILIMLYAPTKNPQRPLKSNNRKKILKAGACSLVLLQVLAIQQLAIPKDIAVASITGILFQTFTISPPGYRFIDWLDKLI